MSKAIYINPAKIYLFKANNDNTREKCEIRSKLTKFKVTSLTAFWCFYCQL